MSEPKIDIKAILRTGSILIAIPCAVYLGLTWLGTLFPDIWLDIDLWLKGYGGQVRVAVNFISFLLVPITGLLILRKNLDLQISKGWLYPGLFYLGVTLLAGGFFFIKPSFYTGFEHDIYSSQFVLWALVMGARVAPIDFFTKRIVQQEATAIGGDVVGQLAQFVAWTIAHIIEFFWLVPLWGYFGSGAFIIATGLASGFIYSKGGSVTAFMFFHWLCNVVLVLIVSF